MQVEALTPLLEVVPGRPVTGRIRVVNDTSRDTSYRIRVVGIDAPSEWRPVAGGAVAAGTEVHVEVPIQVPELLGTGQHPVGVEVTSDQISERPGLASFTVSVESVADVLLRAEPSIIRGSTRGKFRLDIENRESTPVTLELVGGATDITATFKPGEVYLNPGERATSKGKLKGRRRWSGDPEQHFVTLTARGRASSTSITTRFVQRSMFPWRFRRLVAALVVLALWLAGAGAYVLYQNHKKSEEADRRAAEQQLLEDAESSGDGSDAATDGSGEGGAGGGGGGADAGADEASKFPTETTFGGAVTLADGADPSAVKVELDEIPLGQAAEGAQPSAFMGERQTAKIWSARYGSGDRPGLLAMRQTETIRSVDTGKDGTWKISKVALRRNYEVVFSRPGYDTQSFVVTPPEDGKPVELEVEMQPGIGVIAGVVRDTSGALGGVTLVATDGDLSFATTSSTDAGTLGEFSFNGLSTPAVYSVTASRAGFGTEVVQFDLAAGQARAGEVISMRKGVGSITGTVLAKQVDASGGTAEQPFGGVTVTVTNGDLVRTVTTLTEGAVGTFSVPRLPIPGTYTVTASVDGYSDASLTVDLTGAESNAVLRLVNQFAILRGLVVDDSGNPVSGAGITLSHDDVSFTSNTVSDETATGATVAGFSDFLLGDGTARLREMTSFGAEPGEFRISDLPPGEYRIEILHFAHEPYSASVILKPGDDQFLSISLAPRKEVVGAKQSLSVFASENGERQLEGVKFWIRRPGEPHVSTVPATMPAAGNKIVTFENLELGTYILRAELENYRTNEILVSVGATAAAATEIKLRPFGNVVVRIVDSITAEEVDDYGLRLVEVREDSLQPQIIDGTINPVSEQELNGIVWSTGISEDLNDGIWKIEVRNHPDGYRILDQDIIFEPPIVDNVTESLQFEVRSDSRPTIEIKLKANALPKITVRAYHPPASTGGPLEVTLLGGAELTVELRCGATLKAVAVPDKLANGVRTGIYQIPKELLESPLFLSSNCEVAANGEGYQESLAPLNGLLQVANDVTTFDRQVSLVVVPRTVTVRGRVSWFDGIQDVYLPDAVIRSTSEVIIGYQPTQTVGVAIPDKPIAATGFVEAGWDDHPDHPGIAEQRRFTIAGQVFDSGQYQISFPDAANPTLVPGTVSLTVPVATSGSALTATNTATTQLASPTQGPPAAFDFDEPTNTYDYNVKLLQPEDGLLQGCLTLQTTRLAPAFSEVIGSIRAFPLPSAVPVQVTQSDTVPGCPVDDPGTANGSQTQGFERIATAGQWLVDYVLPAGGWYQYDPNVAAPPAARIEPGQTRDGFNRTLVENGTIQLTIVPRDAINGPQPVLDTTYSVSPYVGYTGVVLPPVDINAATSTSIRGVPVAAGNPFTRVTDHLNLTIPGYDLGSASVSIGASGSQTGASQIPIDVQAGETVAVQVTMDPLGQISGSIKGYVWRLPGDHQPVIGFDQVTGLEVQARRVDYDPGTLQRLAPANEADWFALPPPTAGLTPNQTDNSIDFALSSVAPGSYEFRVIATTNPVETAYQLGPVSPAGVQLLDVEFPAPSFGNGAALVDGTVVYAMRNGETIPIGGPLGLVLEPSTLDLRVWNSYNSNTGSGVALAGAQMRVYRISDGRAILPSGLPAAIGADPATTLWTLTDAASTIRLQPDTYRLEIVDRASGDDLSYPATIQVTLPSGDTLAERSMRVDAILPALDFQLAVHIKVVNEDWQPVDLITANDSMNRLFVPDGVQVTRNWSAPSSFVTEDGVTTPVGNSAVLGVPQILKTCASGDLDPTCGDNAAGYERTLVFDRLPSGTHSLSIAAPTGYTLVPRPPAIAQGTAPNITLDFVVDGTDDEFDLVLRVRDVRVDVTITGSDADQFPNQSAALYYGGSPVVDGDINVVRSAAAPTLTSITGLPPRRGPYELRLDDELHAPNWDDGITPPPHSAPLVFDALVDTDDNPATYQQPTTTVVADVGRLAATLRLENSPNGCAVPPGPINANCGALPVGGVFNVDNVAATHASGVATLDFDRTVAETHSVAVSNGAAYTSFLNAGLLVPRGKITTLNVELLKLAVINLDVSGAAVGNVLITPTIAPGTATYTRLNPPQDSVPNRWKFTVSADATSIGFDVSAPGLFPVTIAPIATSTGLVQTVPVSLATRTITVRTTSSNNAAFTPTITVQVPVTSPTYNQQFVASSAATSFNTVFPINAGGPIPNTGQAKAVVSAPGFRSNEGETTGTITSNQNIDVQLRPLVAVTGQLTVSPTPIPTGSTTVVTATNGAITHPATVTGTGSYSFVDKFDVGTWTVNASVIGWGAGSSAPFTISPGSADNVAVPPIVLAAREIKANLSVTRPNGGGAVDPADWEAVGLSKTGAVVSLMESGTIAPSLVLRESTSLRTPVTLNLSTAAVNTVPNPDTVTVNANVTLYQAPVLQGSVRRANNNDPDDGVVSLFSGSCSGAVPAGSPSNTASNSTGLFAFAITAFDTSLLPFNPAGTNNYCLRASKGARTGALSFTLTVVAGVVVVTSGTQSIPSNLSNGYRVELGIPQLTVTKSNPTLLTDADGSGDRSKDDVLRYTVTATNSGSITLTDVDVTDNKITPGSNNCAVVAPGATCVLTGTYTIKAGDVGGNIVNVANATSDQVAATAPATVTTAVPAPAMTLAQPAPVLQTDADGSGDISAGDTLRFTITATNSGTANLTNVVVVGALPAPDATTTCATLAPAATCVVAFNYVVLAGDVGSTINSNSQATSTQVNATPAPRSVVVPTPSLTLTMPAPTENELVAPVGLNAGDTLTYTLTATAAGTANLSNVVVTATVTSPSGRTLSPATPTTCVQVLSGATCVLVVTYTIVAGDSGQSIVVQASATSTQATVSSVSRTTPIP